MVGVVDCIPSALRLNQVSPLCQITQGLLKAETLGLGGRTTKANRVGIFGFTADQLAENGRKSIRIQKEKASGMYAPGVREEAARVGGQIQGRNNTESGHIQELGRIQGPKNTENGRRSGQKHFEQKTGIFKIGSKERTEISCRGIATNKKNGTGFFDSKVQAKNGRMAGHKRWHVSRDIVKSGCALCQQRENANG